jgi:hypothetical protein
MSRSKLLLILGLVVLAVLGLSFFSPGSSNKIDGPPPESSEIDYSNQAKIVDGEELFDLIGGPDAYDYFSKDLQLFAKTAYPEYKDEPTKIIGFKINSVLKKEGDTIIFDGRFGSVENRIDARIQLLKNNRIKTSLTDVKTKLNIDSELPSNNKRDQFIGGLPLITGAFEIEYLGSSDSFLLTIYDGVSKPAAEKALTDGLGISDLSAESYNTFIPTSAGEGEGFPTD